jgi:hypothetical protein
MSRKTTKPTSDISAAAAAMGRLGGKVGGRSTGGAKAAAARANGAKGGRPRKQEPKTP